MANIGKVTVRPTTRTTISSPNFKPRVNVAITEIQQVNVTSRLDGDTLIYDAASGEYVSSPLTQTSVDIKLINGGRF